MECLLLLPAIAGPQTLVRERMRGRKQTSLGVDVGWVDDGVGGDGADRVVVYDVVRWSQLTLLRECQLSLVLLTVDDLSLFLPGVIARVKQRRQRNWEGRDGVSLNSIGVRGVKGGGGESPTCDVTW